MVRCKMAGCPYYQKEANGVCAKPGLLINEDGMCDLHWYRGKRMNVNLESLDQKKEIIVMEAEIS